MSEHPPELVETVGRAIWLADDSESWGEGSRAYYDKLGRAALDAITETHAVVRLPEGHPGESSNGDGTATGYREWHYDNGRGTACITLWDHGVILWDRHGTRDATKLVAAAAALLAAAAHAERGTEAPD